MGPVVEHLSICLIQDKNFAERVTLLIFPRKAQLCPW